MPDTASDAIALLRALDGLHLLYATHAQHAFLPDPAAFRQVLAARLAALNALLTSRHAELSLQLPASASVDLAYLHDALRQGYQLLLSQ